MARRLGYKILILSVLLSFYACNLPLKTHISYNAPEFDEDSCYSILQDFVKIGPRVPNTPEHKKAGEFIDSMLRSFGYKTILQRGVVYRFDSLPLKITNIWTISKPDAKKHILLFAHWDSRFNADHDPNPKLRHKPVLGANDGGSGVSILLEIARLLKKYPVDSKVSIDFIFFDAEDQGPPNIVSTPTLYDWALGSSYWVKHKPVDYKPDFAIGLDMVGYKYAKFSMEGCSLYYYGYLTKKIWQIAWHLGYDTIFVNVRTPGIFDDHVVLNEKGGIRSVMIMEDIPKIVYNPYWHTTKDSLQIIGKDVLKAVGQTLIDVIYNVN